GTWIARKGRPAVRDEIFEIVSHDGLLVAPFRAKNLAYRGARRQCGVLGQWGPRGRFPGTAARARARQYPKLRVLPRCNGKDVLYFPVPFLHRPRSVLAFR